MTSLAGEHSSRIQQVLAHWPRPEELVTFAIERHGFGDSNGGFGVTYPNDLDEFDRANGDFIPEGAVEIYGYWGKPDGWEHQVLESEYLGCLVAYLQARGLVREAAEVQRIEGTPNTSLERTREK
jgi:hypothetical protein